MRAVDRMCRDVRWIYDEKVKSVGTMGDDGVPSRLQVRLTEVAREVQEVGGGFIMPFGQRIKTNPARGAH